MLTYPLEMYYPNYEFDLPSMSDQILIITEYKNYIHECHQNNYQIDKEHISIKAMSFLLEKQKQVSYFQGVREIMNLILSEIKTPDELFASMFPDRESLVYLFKQQYLDACELLLMEDMVNWDKMNLTWDKYNKGKLYKQEVEVKEKEKENNTSELEELKNILNEQVSIFKKEEGIF